MGRPILVLMLSTAVMAAARAPAVAQPAPTTRDLERINWMEFKALVPSVVPTVLLPLGSLEAHGVTANGADILAPVAMARDMAARV
ncbi:creatininase family protein, partial [bacterium]|nr:creatininase family protein [bacterium]